MVTYTHELTVALRIYSGFVSCFLKTQIIFCVSISSTLNMFEVVKSLTGKTNERKVIGILKKKNRRWYIRLEQSFFPN